MRLSVTALNCEDDYAVSDINNENQVKKSAGR
jgi:hypothetical protein